MLIIILILSATGIIIYMVINVFFTIINYCKCLTMPGEHRICFISQNRKYCGIRHSNLNDDLYIMPAILHTRPVLPGYGYIR